MKPCKAKLPEGEACPNQVDEGQEYCPYHLASQVADEMKPLLALGTLLAAAIVPVAGAVIGEVIKSVARKKL